MKNRESFEEDEEEEENPRQSLNCFSGNIKTLEVSSLPENHHHKIIISRRRTTRLCRERSLRRCHPAQVFPFTGV